MTGMYSSYDWKIYVIFTRMVCVTCIWFTMDFIYSPLGGDIEALRDLQHHTFTRFKSVMGCKRYLGFSRVYVM